MRPLGGGCWHVVCDTRVSTHAEHRLTGRTLPSAAALVAAPVTVRCFCKPGAHPPCLLRLDFVSCLSHRGLSSFPALVSSAFVGNRPYLKVRYAP